MLFTVKVAGTERSSSPCTPSRARGGALRIGRVTGREIGHVGKVVLLPAGPRSGTLTVNVPTVEEVTHYFAVIEMADESLETKSLKLVKGKKYLWSLKAEGGQTAFRVMADGVEVASLTGGTDSVKGFGFASTVRAKGNEADATVTFD